MTKGMYYAPAVVDFNSLDPSRETIYFLSETLFLQTYILMLDGLTCIQRKEKVKEFDWRNNKIGAFHAYIVPDGELLKYASLVNPYEMLPPTGSSTQVINNIGWNFRNLFASVAQERTDGWAYALVDGTWTRRPLLDTDTLDPSVWTVNPGEQAEFNTQRVPDTAAQGGGGFVSIRANILQEIGEALIYSLYPSCWAPGNAEFQVVNPPDPEYTTSEFVLGAQTVLANHSLPLNKITFKGKKS